MPVALFAHIAPFGRQHINLTGDYLWDVDAPVADGFRPLRGIDLQGALPHDFTLGSAQAMWTDLTKIIEHAKATIA